MLKFENEKHSETITKVISSTTNVYTYDDEIVCFVFFSVRKPYVFVGFLENAVQMDVMWGSLRLLKSFYSNFSL